MWSVLNPFVEVGNWSFPTSIAPDGSADPSSSLAAINRELNAVDVYWVSPSGAIMTNAANPNFNHGNWNNPIEIAAAGSAVTASR
jgi:hypothetical protein